MTQMVEVGKDSKEEAVRVLRLPDGTRVEAIARLCDCTCRDGYVELELIVLPPSPLAGPIDLATQHETMAQELEQQLAIPEPEGPPPGGREGRRGRGWTWCFRYSVDTPRVHGPYSFLGHFEVGYWLHGLFYTILPVFGTLKEAQAKVKELNEPEALAAKERAE